MLPFHWFVGGLLWLIAGTAAMAQTAEESGKITENLEKIQATCDKAHPLLSHNRAKIWATGRSLSSWVFSAFGKPGTSGGQIRLAREALASCAAGAYENAGMISNYSSEEIGKFTKLAKDYLVDMPKSVSDSYRTLAKEFPAAITIPEPKKPGAKASAQDLAAYFRAESLHRFDVYSVQSHEYLKGMADQVAGVASKYESEIATSIAGCASKRGNSKKAE